MADPPRRRQREPETEVLSRVRRIETRVTQMAIALGIDTQAQKPVFSDKLSRIQLPSRHSSMKEILEAVPETWEGPVEIFIGGERVATLRRDRAL